MKSIFFFLILVLVQDVAFKPSDEFELKLDYQFKPRPQRDISNVDIDDATRERIARGGSGILPYLILNLKLLKLADEEVRIQITSNLDRNGYSRKIQQGMIIPIIIGFTDDVKDKVVAHHYTIAFLSASKQLRSKIVILIEEDGTFLVNEEKRGKF
jgi:hypothetical protein